MVQPNICHTSSTKLIIDVPGKTPLEVTEFFFPVVFSLLLWKGCGSPSAAPESPA